MEHKGTSNLREERQEREKKEKVYRDNFYKAILALETMEECDALYGATMQESGITRLVSVQLKEAVTLAE